MRSSVDRHRNLRDRWAQPLSVLARRDAPVKWRGSPYGHRLKPHGLSAVHRNFWHRRREFHPIAAFWARCRCVTAVAGTTGTRNMAHLRVGLLAAALISCVGPGAASAASAFTERPDGALQIDGRTLRCGNARSKLDARLPNLGMSIPDARLLVFNPTLLGRQTGVVRVFVFHHECGHQHVGASETAADCWAVRRGVSEGWLQKKGLPQICRSFGNAPASSTHPAAAARCANLDRCFAVATESVARQKRLAAAPSASSASASAAPRARQLVSGPSLIRTGVVR